MSAAFVVGAIATWGFVTWPAPFSITEPWPLLFGLAVAGGGVIAFVTVRAASDGMRVISALQVLLLGAIWLSAIRLLVHGSLGPIRVDGSSIWIVLFVLAVLEAVLFNLRPPGSGQSRPERE